MGTDHILDTCRQQGVAALETFTTPAREHRRASLPSSGRFVHFAAAVKALGVEAGSLWLHQTASLEAVAAGDNLVLATGTASGKSLVFQAAVIASLLAEDSRHLVFYPQKALAADQKQRWIKALEHAGLPPTWVGEINGDIAMATRERVVAEARILLVTPDVVHAWMMRSLALCESACNNDPGFGVIGV